MANDGLRDLGLFEKVFMLGLIAALVGCLTLIVVDSMWEYIRPAHSCGYECREDLEEIQKTYIEHREAAHSCAGEFYECLHYLQNND